MRRRHRNQSRGRAFDRLVQYDRTENESPSVAVATALAEYRDEAVTSSSTRLYDYVDPEALDALFADTHDGRRRRAGRVTFEVDDLTVDVRDERVEIYPSD